MPKAIERFRTGLIAGTFSLGLRGGVSGSVRQEVHDGDTLNVRTSGSFGVRFLAVDAPEMSFTLPGSRAFLGLSNSRWQDFLRDPFSSLHKPINPPLAPKLLKHLQARIGSDAALNHQRHATAAEAFLEQEVEKDISELRQDVASFRFFVAFAHEVMDRYGRMLGFVHPHEPKASTRKLSFNERLLEAGKVVPYLIWPNINPFRSARTLMDAVIPPGKAATFADGDAKLRQCREWVKAARKRKIGLFQAKDSLRLLPFEVRYLAQRRPPDRWVIDLASNESVLIQPQNYITVRNVEDRLFIPREYVPLFIEAGWKRQK